MSNLVKVTYFGKNRPTIINTDKVESIYEMVDVNSQKRCTKVQFSKDNYILVDETPQEIMKMEWSVKNGNPIDMDFESPTLDDIIENSYYNHPNIRQQRPTYQARPQRRRIPMFQDDYNNFNNNQY